MLCCRPDVTYLYLACCDTRTSQDDVFDAGRVTLDTGMTVTRVPASQALLMGQPVGTPRACKGVPPLPAIDVGDETHLRFYMRGHSEDCLGLRPGGPMDAPAVISIQTQDFASVGQAPDVITWR